MRYNDSNEQCAQYLRLVIPFLAKYKLAANPIAYTVGYEYIAQSNKALRKEIDDRLERGEDLSDDFIFSLYETHISGRQEKNLKRMNEDMRRVVSEVMATTTVADEEATKYTQSLMDYGNELEEHQEGNAIEKIVRGLIEDTRVMQTAAAEMQSQLDESKREIESLHSQLDEIREESLTDALTGLTNRKGFSQKIDSVLANQESLEERHCVLMVDIDHFKKVNDTYGHLVGDKVIQFVAATLKKQVKGKDTVARFGGEEYVVLLPETGLEGAGSVAENVRGVIEKTRIKRMDTGEPIGQVTVSIGIAQYLKGESVDDFLQRADAALYRSKENGRNLVTIDDTETLALQESMA